MAFRLMMSVQRKWRKLDGRRSSAGLNSATAYANFKLPHGQASATFAHISHPSNYMDSFCESFAARILQQRLSIVLALMSKMVQTLEKVLHTPRYVHYMHNQPPLRHQNVQHGTGQDEIDLLHFVKLIWRGKWIIAACVLVLVLSATLFVREIAVPRYQATSKILISPNTAQIIDFQSIVSGTSTDATAINTELEIINAPAMIEKLVLDQRLYANPEFNPYLREGETWFLPKFFSMAHALIFGAPPPRPEQTHEQAIQAAMNTVVYRNLRLQSQDRTHIFNIHITTESRKTSVNLANALAKIYIQQQIENKFEAASYATDWLSERVSEISAEVQIKEDALNKLLSTSGALKPEALEFLYAQQSGLADRLDRSEAAFIAAQERFQQAKRLREAGNLQELAVFLDDSILTRLSSGSNPGDLQSSDAALRLDVIFSQMNAQVTREENNRRALQDSLKELRAEIEQKNGKLNEFLLLNRDLEASRIILDTFSTRLKETSLQAGLIRADSQLISPARNALQVEPRTKRTYSLSVVFGTIVGIGIVLLKQFSQDTYRSIRELEVQTGITALGEVPLIPIKRRNQLIPYLRSKPASAASEAIRNLRTSLTMMGPSEKAQVIALSSSTSGEGKTTLAISLAINFSNLGKRTLLIEGDIRRLTLTEYFHNTNEHGVADVLSGAVALESAVVHDDILGLDILHGQETDTNAADLFATGHMERVIEDARKKYDYIIIDTPPVLIVTDARLIARYCDNLIYVVRWNSTSRAQVSNGLQQFHSGSPTVLNVVLSQVDYAKSEQYGYGNYNPNSAYYSD